MITVNGKQVVLIGVDRRDQMATVKFLDDGRYRVVSFFHLGATKGKMEVAHAVSQAERISRSSAADGQKG